MGRFLVLFALVTAAPGLARGDRCVSNLMIVLDRSCSMNMKPISTETRTKWEIAKSAINQLITQYSAKLNFGLIMFPDQTAMACVQDGPIYVQIGPDRGATVASALDGGTPGSPCVTNIDTAMAQVSTDPAYAGSPADAGVPTGNRGFALLITDGSQAGCGNDATGTTAAETNIKNLYARGYPTYVIGFGGGVSVSSLNRFANAGGVARAGTQKYYQADDSAALESTLDMIAGLVSSGEIPTCPGPPCPDGRCFGPQESCVDGHCSQPIPDGGILDGSEGSDGGDAGSGAGAHGSGCGCQFHGNEGPWLPSVAAMFVYLLLRRRRV